MAGLYHRSEWRTDKTVKAENPAAVVGCAYVDSYPVVNPIYTRLIKISES